MTRLTDALESLARMGEPRGPDAVLGAARVRAASLRRRRLVAMGGVAVLVLALAGTAGAIVLDRDGATTVESGLAATTEAPTTPPPATGPGPTSAPTTSTAPGPTTTPADGSVVVEIHLLADTATDCTTTRAVERTVRGPAVLRGALDELLEGPTGEETAAGLHSWFSAGKTADAIRSVDIVAGVAKVDFDDDFLASMPGVSTSCGSGGLFAQLDGTVTQFDGVERAVYSLDGDVAAFYQSLEGSAPDGSSSTPEADGIASWPGAVVLDPSGALDLGDFAEHLARVDPSGALSADAVVSLLLHLEDERARGALVHIEDRYVDGGHRGMAVTLSGLGDDSVAEVRYELTFSVRVGSRPELTSASWAQRCHQGRGHQDLRPDLCI